MTFEGHTDGAPRVLPRRDHGEALLAIQDAAPGPPGEAGLDLHAGPAGEMRDGGFDLYRFRRLACLPASGGVASSSSARIPSGRGMTTAVDHLSSAQWDTWYREGRAVDRLVTASETERFLQHITPSAGSSVLDVGCGIGRFSRQLVHWGYDVLGLDFSSAAIQTAQRQGTGDRLRYGVHDVDADAIPPQLPPASLDLIVCRNVLPFIDHQRFMVGARRWLRPGGQLYVLVRVCPGRGAEPDERPWQRGFTEEQVQALQNGWAEQERCWLGRHTALFLSGECSRPL